MRRRSLLLLTIAVFGYALLYVPILSVVAYSFNDSRLVTLWGGFSLRWYRSLLENEELLEAAWLSFRIAVVSATVATIFGALIALVLQRLRRYRGRLLLSGMVTAPLVMPEIITGLSTAVPVHLDGGPDRLADGARRHDHHHRTHYLLHGLRGGRAALAACIHG